jgi:Tfp pilus assembly protein PilV
MGTRDGLSDLGSVRFLLHSFSAVRGSTALQCSAPGDWMSEMGAPRTVNTLRALSLVLGLLALAGWGTYAYAAKSSAAAQQRLSEQVGELKVREGQLIAERDEAKAQLAATQDEVADLKANRDQLLAERDEAKAQLAAAREEITTLQKRLEEAQAKASETGSLRAPTPSGNPGRSSVRTQRTRR